MSEIEIPQLEDVRAAVGRTREYLHHTPLVHSRTFSEWLGYQVYFKCENLQKTGSFKPRGGLNRIATLPAEDSARGVITISAGNHAQGVAYAAAKLQVPAVIVMPENAVPSKVEAARSYGAECILHGDVHAAFEKLHELQESRGLTLVHPFDDAMLVAGHGTVGWEIHEDLPQVDAVVCGIGGGGLIAGIATAMRELAPDARIFGVEPEGAATMSEALAAGAVVRLEKLDTIADGLAPPFVGELNLAVVQSSVETVVRVSDVAIGRAMRVILERTKMLAEPAGAAALAALLEGQLPIEPGSVVAVVISGGNVDLDRLPEMISSPAR